MVWASAATKRLPTNARTVYWVWGFIDFQRFCASGLDIGHKENAFRESTNTITIIAASLVDVPS